MDHFYNNNNSNDNNVEPIVGHEVVEALNIVQSPNGETIESSLLLIHKTLLSFPRDCHGRLATVEGIQLVEVMVSKYGLFNSLYQRLKEANDQDEDPSKHLCCIMLLATMQNPRQAQALSFTGIMEELLALLCGTDDYEYLQPSTIAVITNVISQASIKLSEAYSIIDTLLDLHWNHIVGPYALAILDQFGFLILEHDELRKRTIQRLRDEQGTIDEEYQGVVEASYQLLYRLLGDRPCFLEPTQYEISKESNQRPVLIP